MVPDRQQAIGVRRQINTHDGSLLVDHMIDETRILMGKTIMGLLPDVGGEQIIERGDFSPPRQFGGDLQPLGVLVEHRIDDVDKGLIAVEQPVSTGEQISFEPSFALMLAEHLHDPAFGCEKFIVVLGPGLPLPIGDLKNGVQAVGKRLVGAEDPEIPLLFIEFDHIAQELSQHVGVGGLN